MRSEDIIYTKFANNYYSTATEDTILNAVGSYLQKKSERDKTRRDRNSTKRKLARHAEKALPETRVKETPQQELRANF